MCSLPRESRWFFERWPDAVRSGDLAKHFGASVKCFDISNCVKTVSSFAVLVNLCNTSECLHVLRVVAACSEPWIWPMYCFPSRRALPLVGLRLPNGVAMSQTSSSRLKAKLILLLKGPTPMLRFVLHPLHPQGQAKSEQVQFQRLRSLKLGLKDSC